MGLVNRGLANGELRSEAEALARSRADFPETCMREDRLSVLEQDPQEEDNAMGNRAAARDAVAGRAGAKVARFHRRTGRLATSGSVRRRQVGKATLPTSSSISTRS
jgi:hypothetical protein